MVVGGTERIPQNYARRHIRAHAQQVPEQPKQRLQITFLGDRSKIVKNPRHIQVNTCECTNECTLCVYCVAVCMCVCTVCVYCVCLHYRMVPGLGCLHDVLQQKLRARAHKHTHIQKPTHAHMMSTHIHILCAEAGKHKLEH